jgi:hypothetical protein
MYRRKRKQIDWRALLGNKAYNIRQIAELLRMNVPAARRHVMYAYNNKVLQRARRGRVYYYIVATVLQEVIRSEC